MVLKYESVEKKLSVLLKGFDVTSISPSFKINYLLKSLSILGKSIIV